MPEPAGRGTILHRVSSALWRQDWTAVLFEIVIVFVGVLLGTQVSNWNDARKQQTEVSSLLQRLKPELRAGVIESPSLAKYYQSRLALGEKAESLLMTGGDDLGLVTSARLTGSYAWVVDFDRDTYVMKIGADTMSHIPNGKLRTALADLIQLKNDPYVRYSYLDTDFRRLVLRLYPSEIGYKITRDCNLVGVVIDKTVTQLRSVSTTACASALPSGEVARLAAALRSDPTALGLLREHLNRLQTARSRIDRLEKANRDVLIAMGESPAAAAKR